MHNLRLYFTLYLTLISPLVGLSKINSNSSSKKGFVKNNGQVYSTDGTIANQVLYKLSSNNLDVYLTKKGISYVFKEVLDGEIFKSKNPYNSPEFRGASIKYHTVTANLIGINPDIEIEGEIPEEGGIFYYDKNFKNGVIKTSSYRKVVYKNIYPNIDWLVYLNENGNLKYDFVVKKGGNPKDINLKYEGINEISNDDKGSIAKFKIGLIEDKDLYVYQEAKNGKVTIDCKINRKGFTVGYGVGSYDKEKELIIDPYVTWSTYFGGTQNETSGGLVVDNQDRIIISGATLSTNFPVMSLAGAYNISIQNGNSDAYVTMFDKNGVQLWTTYIGGSNNEYPYGWLGRPLTVDENNNILLTGQTNSLNFPIQNLTGAYNQSALAGGYDAFVMKFSPSGSLLWSTYLGGSGNDAGCGLRTNSGGKLFVGGWSYSTNFPLKVWTGAYNQPNNFSAINNSAEGGFVAAFDSISLSLTWSTYFTGDWGSYACDFIFDNNNNIFILANSQYYGGNNLPITNPGSGAYYSSAANGGNYDAFIAKLSPKGIINWGTYFGGTASDGVYWGEFNKFDNTLYFSGVGGPAYPIQSRIGAYNNPNLTGSRDYTINQFSLSGKLLWSSYFGGLETGLNDNATGLTITSDSSIYVPGNTNSTNFPLVSDGKFFQGANAGGIDFTLTRFNKNGLMTYSTYFGGSGTEGYNATSNLSHNSSGEVIYQGFTNSPCGTFPLFNPGNNAYFSGNLNGGYDSFIARFSSNEISGQNVSCTALGIDEIQLNGSLLKDGSVYLVWKSFITSNTESTYEIEISNDGKNWQKTNISPTTKSTLTISYSSLENVNPINYFRVKQILNQENIFYSNVISISFQQLNITLYPNPSNGIINYRISNLQNVTYQIKILNNLSQIITIENILNKSGSINIEYLPSGIYNFEIWSNDQLISNNPILKY